MSLDVVVLTSDKYRWLIKPFAYLFNIYWSELQPVIVAGFSAPEYELPPNFTFFQIAPDNYPADKWSDGLIHLLKAMPCDRFVWLLDDYLLCRTVDCRGVKAAGEYMADRPDILRYDLTADRLYAGEMRDLEPYGCYDIITTPHTSPYQFSTQAAVWNKELLVKLLVPGKSPWETEIHTSVPPEMRVVGTRQYPVRYANAVYKGKVDLMQLSLLQEPHKQAVLEMIPTDWRPKDG